MPKKVTQRSRRPSNRKSPRQLPLHPVGQISIQRNGGYRLQPYRTRWPVKFAPRQLPLFLPTVSPLHPVGPIPIPRSGGYWIEPDRNDFKVGDGCKNRYSDLYGTWIHKFPGDQEGGCWGGPVHEPGDRCDFSERFGCTQYGVCGRSRDGVELVCEDSANFPYFSYWQPKFK